ncbi:hypothetical protein AXF42_Ash017143 [Apostasia shenzhenica]|uniref:Uncharacterized protein n=1 Tax=Apostasia shenzhenica TaxID=1088818 RepID=A0A2H9ZV87_9ASPA|nr:hypothetical protein AXF42_Ash017143 [Apostasia shenzhenica]
MQKGTTECSKSALPDDGFGKDFFNSWKLGKVENESIDFDFETVPKNKMGSFKFDELDSFELSGNFEKLASFKLDIPNLDFSSMSKKNEKTRENSTRDISKGKDFKEDKFSFDFDFNSFEFDSKSQKDDRRHSTCATVREHSSKNVKPDSSKNITADTNVPTSSEPDKLTRLNKESFDFAQKTALSTTKQISSVEDNQKEPGLSTIHRETSHPMHMGKEDSADSLGFHLQSFSGDSSGEALSADKISTLQVDAAKCTSMMQKGDPMQPICSSASSPSRSSSPVDSFNSGCGPKSCMKQVQNKGAEAEIQKHQVKTQLANGLIQLKKDVSSIRCSKNSTMTLKIGEEKLKSDKNLVSPLLKSSFQHNPVNAKNMSEPLLQKLTSASPKILSAENDKANLNLRTRLGSQTMRSVSNNVALDPYSILTSSVATYDNSLL